VRGRLFRLVWGDDVDPALRGLRGAYMSAFGSSFAVSFALGLLATLQLRGASGDDAM
jgi:hypothetical protein